jgi:hypothetical protein
MDLLNMLAELRAERTRVEQAILVIERLAHAHGARRGRPPAWMVALNENAPGNAPKRKGRPPGSRNKPKPAPTG